MSPWLIGVLAIGTVAAAWWVAQLGTGRGERPLERGGVLPAPATGGELPPAEEPEIRRLLAAGKKIEAIKRYREATGLGLKEAKDAVEAME